MNNLIKGLLVTSIVLAVLSGCGGNNDNAANNQAEGAQEMPSEQPSEQPAEPARDPNAEIIGIALSEQGTWSVALPSDVTAQELVATGMFHEADDAAKPLQRKLELGTYTLTVSKLTVQSENFVVAGGTVKGDIYVEANGFYLDPTATVDGDIYFPNQELKTTAQIYGKVTGFVR